MLWCVYILILAKMLLSSVAQWCPSLCNHMDCSTSGFPVHHQLPEFTQTHVHWVSDAIQSFHSLLSPSPPAFNLSQHQGLFLWVSSLHLAAKVLDFQLQHQSFQWIFRTDFLEDGMVGSLCSPRDSQESSPTPQFKSIFSSALSFLYSPTVTAIRDYWKNHSSDYMSFFCKVMSLLFNILSRLVIAFPLQSKLQSPSAVICEFKTIKPLTVSIVSPFICHDMMRPDVMILVFWMLSFKSTLLSLNFK